MSFFSRKQKRLAMRCNSDELKNAYHTSEENLRRVAKTGNEKQLKIAMKEHGNYEYAMLYTNTPEYAKRMKRRNK